MTWEQDGEQFLAVISGWGGAVPLWGGEVAKKVNYLNQGGTRWTFCLPKQLASANCAKAASGRANRLGAPDLNWANRSVLLQLKEDRLPAETVEQFEIHRRQVLQRFP